MLEQEVDKNFERYKCSSNSFNPKEYKRSGIFGYGKNKVLTYLLIATLAATSAACIRRNPVGPEPNLESKVKIAFASNRDGDFEIYTMKPDGTEVRQLTFNDYKDGHPSWSPDGRIAFESNGNVCVMNSDGSNIIQLTAGYTPSFSPDGEKIAFELEKPKEPNSKQLYDIYVMGADGSNIIKVTMQGEGAVYPSWSSIDKVAFSTDSALFPNEPDIYSVDLGTLRSERLIEGIYPSWSYQCDGFVYNNIAREAGGGILEIYKIDINGNNQLLTEGYGANWGYSKNKVVFTHSNGAIQVINIDGSNKKTLTTEGENKFPSWSPILE